MRLTESVSLAVADGRAPASMLALTYAERIDEAAHVPHALAEALRKLESAAEAYVDIDPSAPAAFRRVAAQLAVVSVASDLGPKLLATLDALMLTPKAKAATERGVGDAARSAGRLGGIRNRYDERARHLRAVG